MLWYGHEEFEEGERIHSSYIKKAYKIGNDEIALVTYSGTLYCLCVADIMPEKMDETIQRLNDLPLEFNSDYIQKMEGKKNMDERENEVGTDRFNHFGEAMPDGRLTAPSNGKVYRLRDAIVLSEWLGRPLDSAEMKKFEIE